MGKDKQMAEYLCETCKHCNQLVMPHYIDTAGTERRVKVMYVDCAASRKNVWRKKAPMQPVYADVSSVCYDYKRKKVK